MSANSLNGSCLCGVVRFEVSPPFTAFRYCHCSRCRKASGSAHAANAFVPESQFRWLAGEAMIKRFDLPDAQRFSVWFCPQCGSRVPHKVRSRNDMLIPAGLLDQAPDQRPDSSIFWGSRAAWYVEPSDRPCLEGYT